jgi:tetratricopeptide (TPR) repeat protein
MNKELNKEKTIFFSYSFKDTEVVDEIDNDFQGFAGIDIKRCVRDIGYTESIKEFMKKVRETDFVFIVVSDAFIKSCNCMYEVTELFKENDFKKRILPIFPYESSDERRAKIFNPEDRAEIVHYWNNRREELEINLNNITRESTTKLDDDLKKYREICNIVGEFIDTVSDMNYIPLNQLKKDRYEQILKKIGYKETDIEFKLILIVNIGDDEDRDIELDNFTIKNPKYFGGFYKKGLIALNNKKNKIAIYNFTKAIELKHDYAEAYNDRGNAYARLNRYEEAIVEYNEAVKLKPDFVYAYNNRGNAYRRLHKYEDAIFDFNKAIQMKSDYVVAYNNRGIVYCELMKFEEAMKDFTKSVELNKYYEIAYLNLGYLYFKNENYSKAIEENKKAIKVNPYYVKAYNNLGYCYLKLMNYEDAEDIFNRSIEFDVKLFDSFIGLSILYYIKKNYKEAKKFLYKAIVLEPKLLDGIQGIDKIEKEGYYYNKEYKDILKKIFELLEIQN